MLEEVPDVEYGDIGGLTRQIEQIRDAVELPFLHADLFREYQLRPPKGVLLYGPPGCGKTLIAKAVANSLAKQVALLRGEEKVTSYFLNIKGPELLNKYVGETERTIRLIFQRAREKASDGTPVIVFFDEMDSVFRTRGTGVSSDVETTIVPQLLSEIDGVEGLENVIVIGASNREDMIDPAILRPGRLDVKIKIERPDAEAARDIFTKYLIPELPIHPEDLAEFGGDRRDCIDAMIQHTVERMYTETDENRFLEVTYANGDKEVLYFKDFNSGAMIQNIVDRAKKSAIKARIETRHQRAAGGAAARRDHRRVRRERGPAEHHEPRRLGADLRQEGRADRVHPHAGVRQAVRGIAGHRHRVEHGPVPVASTWHNRSGDGSDFRVCPAGTAPTAAAGPVGASAPPCSAGRRTSTPAAAPTCPPIAASSHSGTTRSGCSTPRRRPASTGSTPPAPTAGPRSSSGAGGGNAPPTIRHGPSRRRPCPANGDTPTSATGTAMRRCTRSRTIRWPSSRRNGRSPSATLPRVHLYQVHSLTLDSPLFDDGPLLDALARLRDSGVAVGFSTSGPRQA